MSTKKNKPPLVLDMDFGEALQRFARTDPKELVNKRKPKSGVEKTGKNTFKINDKQ